MTAKKKGLKHSRDLYERLVDSFRIHGKNWSAVARDHGIDRHTAQVAYEQGWLRQHDWAIPIQERLAAERAEAAKIAQAKIAAEREANEQLRNNRRKQALEAMDQESRAASQARQQAIATVQITGAITKAMVPLVSRLQESLQDAKMTPDKAMQILHRWSHITQKSQDVVRMALEIERLRVGSPLEAASEDLAEMSTEDALRELEDLQRTLERAKRLGTTDLPQKSPKAEGEEGQDTENAEDDWNDPEEDPEADDEELDDLGDDE